MTTEEYKAKVNAELSDLRQFVENNLSGHETEWQLYGIIDRIIAIGNEVPSSTITCGDKSLTLGI